MQRNKYWYKIDNAGKIFPATSNKDRSNVFRLSFYLKHDINKDILEEALNIVLDRIVYFKTAIRTGIFWNYFSENKNKFVIEKESAILCEHFTFRENNGYLFKLYYYNNKISLETFHALTDGTGAMEFLKSIVYEYLLLMGEKIDSEGKILSRQPFSNKENEDSFIRNYDKNLKKVLKEEKAYHLKGESFKHNYSLVVKLSLNTKDTLSKIKNKYNSTLTEYLTSLIAYSILDEGIDVKEDNKPIKMFIPVNLRPYFNSKSLKNFSLYIKSTFDSNKEWSFDEMIEHTKLEFKNQLVKEDLHERLSSLVSLEKNMFIRFVPLFIKNLFFKVGYNLLGESIITSSLSNLGKIDLPKEMLEHVIDLDFINAGAGLSTTVITLDNKLNILFNTPLKDLSVIKSIINKLKEDDIEITLSTNYKEEYNEIL